MDLIYRTGNQKIVIEIKPDRMTRIHTPFHFRVWGQDVAQCSNENIDGQAWYPDTSETVDENSELRF